MRRILSTTYVLLPAALVAQSWGALPVRTFVAFDDTFSTEHVAMDVEGDVLAISRCTDAGGEVRLHARNQGGSDQWDAFAVFTDPRPGFGFSLDLDQGRLAIGIRGSISDVGAVRIMEVDPGALDPVDDWGEFAPNDGLPGDRFGHCVRWCGNQLFVGSPEREFGATGSGIVHAFAVDQQQLLQQGSIQQDAPVLIERAFGAMIACDVQHLAIAAPRATIAPNAHGAVFIFSPDADADWGWSSDTSLIDTDLQPTDSITWDLGREGLFLWDSTLVVHRSAPYSQTEEFDEGGVPRPSSSGPGCAACQLRTYSLGGDGTWSEQSTADLPEGAAVLRSRQGWAVSGELAFATGYDTLTSTWSTIAYSIAQDLNWSAIGMMPQVDTCGSYNGPVCSTSQWFIRSSLRRGGACGPDIIAEIFARDPVGLGEFRSKRSLHFVPSPTKDHCRLEPAIRGPGNLTIHSSLGSLVVSLELATTPLDRLDLSGLGTGVYLVNAITTDRTYVGRLVVH